MILAVDVQYVDGKGFVAGVLFDSWDSSTATDEFISVAEIDEEYVPGQFYKRELPCILMLLNDHALSPDIILVDGYVLLDDDESPGLGKYLYDALKGSVMVIGVAKNRYAGIGEQHAVYRGGSRNPLYVTAAGVGIEVARENILSMHGRHRVPTLLKHADKLARESASKRLELKSHE
jgi:deoxyribonuclease V